MREFLSAEDLDGFYTRIKYVKKSIFPWVKPRTIQVMGNGTVWRYFPGGSRVPTHVETWLCSHWMTLKWVKLQCKF